MLVTLNSEFLANGLTCPPGRRKIEFNDTGLPGLYVEVTAASEGVGSLYLRYKDAHGKTCHQKIGRTSDTTLAEARQRAKQLKAEIYLGADPRAAARAKKAVLTYGTMFREFYLPHAKVHKRSWDRDEELFRLRIERVFGGRRLDQITRQQIQLFHTDLVKEGLAAATANHHIKLLKHSLNLAVDCRPSRGRRPAAGHSGGEGGPPSVPPALRRSAARTWRAAPGPLFNSTFNGH